MMSTVNNATATTTIPKTTWNKDSVIGKLTEDQLEKLNKIEKDELNNKRIANQTLDKDAFLKLMTTQLRYQNPMEPMDNKEMIAQMAQFSSVEQLNNMASAMGVNNSANDFMLLKMNEMIDEIKNLNNEIKKLHGVNEITGGTETASGVDDEVTEETPTV